MRALAPLLRLLPLMLLLMPAGAEAGRAPDGAFAERPDPPEQSGQAGVTTLFWQAGYTYPGGRCRILIYFPQGLSESADAAVARFAKEQFDESCSSFVSIAADVAEEHQAAVAGSLAGNGMPAPERSGGADAPNFSVYTYRVFRPSTRFASIHFTGSEYTGGAHGNTFHTILSFDLETGNKLEIEDLFADRDGGLPKLIARIADGVQALKAADADPVDCGPAAIDANMERIALTPEGLRVVYAPYEMGSYAEDEFVVDIPASELAGLGVKPQFWHAPGGKR